MNKVTIAGSALCACRCLGLDAGTASRNRATHA